VPRQTRTSRTRNRAPRQASPARPASVATPVVDAEMGAPESAPAAPAPRRTATRTGAAAARQPRGIVTDYNYVITELKQIFILTVVVLVILAALYFIIG
jgi:hypothetical protein